MPNFNIDTHNIFDDEYDGFRPNYEGAPISARSAIYARFVQCHAQSCIDIHCNDCVVDSLIHFGPGIGPDVETVMERLLAQGAQWGCSYRR